MRFFYYWAFFLCSLLLADTAQAFPWPVFIPAITNMGSMCGEESLYWYDGKCNKVKHPNQIMIEKMAGPWRFMYHYHWDRVDYYYFDINKVSKYPDPQMPNTYMISGADDMGRESSALYTGTTIPYYPFRAQYSIIDNEAMSPYDPYYQPSGIKKYFLFDFINNNEITGTFRDRVDPDWKIHYYPLKGKSKI